MSRSMLTRQIPLLLAVAAVALVGLAPQASAGGGPPRPDDVDFEAVYINCVDDEIDAPGVDGDAIVRVRFEHDYLSNLEVSDGSWELNQEGTALASGNYVTPTIVEAGATWEQVVRIPGGTGAAWFRSLIHIRFEGGMSESLVILDPALGVPGDCEQPDETTTTTPTDPTPTTPERRPDVVVATPRFTG